MEGSNGREREADDRERGVEGGGTWDGREGTLDGCQRMWGRWTRGWTRLSVI